MDASLTCGGVAGCEGEYCGYAYAGAAVLVFCGAAVAAIAAFLRAARGSLYTHERTMLAFGSLYMRYRRGCYYWEVVVLVRRLAFVLIGALLGREEHRWAQLGASAAVVGAHGLRQMRKRKQYSSRGEVWGTTYSRPA